MGMRNERVRIKRAYEEPAPEDGTRALVDRLWPRGLSKERARIDLWLKDIAPSTELRRWYGHDPERFAEFHSRYTDELAREPALTALATLRDLARRGPVTLVYAAKDSAHSNAAILCELLESEPSQG
jgi:uncharacterized protein YeaO (DUF488 family)